MLLCYHKNKKTQRFLTFETFCFTVTPWFWSISGGSREEARGAAGVWSFLRWRLQLPAAPERGVRHYWAGGIRTLTHWQAARSSPRWRRGERGEWGGGRHRQACEFTCTHENPGIVSGGKEGKGLIEIIFCAADAIMWLFKDHFTF